MLGVISNPPNRTVRSTNGYNRSQIDSWKVASGFALVGLPRQRFLILARADRSTNIEGGGSTNHINCIPPRMGNKRQTILELPYTTMSDAIIETI